MSKIIWFLLHVKTEGTTKNGQPVMDELLFKQINKCEIWYPLMIRLVIKKMQSTEKSVVKSATLLAKTVDQLQKLDKIGPTTHQKL